MRLSLAFAPTVVFACAVEGNIVLARTVLAGRLKSKGGKHEKLVIPTVSLFLALSWAVGAQTTIVTVPGEVRTYVLEQKTPSVTFEGDIAVGTALPETVEIHTIPDQPEYSYVIVNNKRVVVNPKTRAVVEIIE